MSASTGGVLAPEMVSFLRHELRTPVNHIVGYCELLLEDASGAAMTERRTALQHTLSTVRDALGLIEAALPANGAAVTQADVEALYGRLREPHERIMAALATLAVPPDDPDFAADVTRIRDATGRLVTPPRPEPGPAAPARAASGSASSAPATSSAAPGDRGRVLVVDDVPDNRDVLMRHLTRQGYAVDTASNGLEALDVIGRAPYDLVLLDMQMPGMDGYEVLGKIKQHPATRDIPVVMVSAMDELATIAACIEAGADDYLPKPFDPVVLRARVSASVEKKRLRNVEIDYLRQVERVADAATAVEEGRYSSGALAEVAHRSDSIGRLARVFDAMAAGVKAREERLRDQVGILRREIDEATRATGASAVVPADAGTLIPGDAFAVRYRIIRVVGRGGMGTVYKAADLELGEDVAIKLLLPEAISSDPTMAERFRSEIRLARRISHRNVVRTHDLGEWEGAAYITMEYVEGITVRDLIDTRKTLSVPSVLGIARQLAAALAVAHEQGVIHRDIKPQNLLLDAAGVLKVMDFGIARRAEAASSITQTGMIVGTPAYMSPEQLLDEGVDARSDLYAAGVVLYECLTGQLPHSASSPVALIAKVLSATPPSPAERNAEVPAPLSSLVMRLMARDPADRPQSAEQLGELLAQLG